MKDNGNRRRTQQNLSWSEGDDESGQGRVEMVDNGPRLQMMDTTTTQPHRESGRSQSRKRKDGMVPHPQAKLSGEVCRGYAPGTIQALARPSRTPWNKLLEELRNQDNDRSKRAMIMLRVEREKGTLAFVEYLGVSREDTVEGSL